VQEREDRGQDTKDAMDEMRKNTKGMEPWQLCQDEVGSGEEDSDAEIGDAEAVELRLGKKLSKRKTRQQRNKKLLIAAEALALATRRANKARTASVLTAPAVISALDESIELSVAEKAADMKVKRARLADRGLTRFRSGPMRVPDAPVTYQLGEELSENLRTLSTEGNLFRSFMDSTYSRGRMAVERASLSKKGGKRGGRGRDKGSKIKWKALYAYKNFVV
jgi:nucleolar protein 53